MTQPQSGRRPRLAYVVSRFPKLSETFILREIEALEARGWDIDVFPFIRCRESVRHPGVERWFAKLEPPQSIAQLVQGHAYWLVRSPGRLVQLYAEVVSTLWLRPHELVRALFAVGLATAWSQRICERDIQHVHAHFAGHPTVAALAISGLAGVPFSFTCHSSDVYRGSTFLKTKLRRADFVIAISQLLRDRYLSCVGSDVRVVRCGVDVGQFRFRAPEPRISSGAGCVTIVSVARLVPVKGLHHLIEACALLQAADFSFRCRIIGDGPLGTSLQRQITRLGLGDLVRLEGARSDLEVRAALEGATVFVLPSVRLADGSAEGVPVSLMEAMSSGVPVVATRSGATGELVEHERTGLVVDAADPRALAAGIIRLARDAALARRLAMSARRCIETEFDLEKNADRLDGLFRTSLQKRARLPASIAP